MSPAERATKERQDQGLPAHVEDDRVLDRVAALLLADDEQAGGGPDQPARRRTPDRSTAAIKQAQDDGT